LDRCLHGLYILGERLDGSLEVTGVTHVDGVRGDG
jgi:hypothetical protein